MAKPEDTEAAAYSGPQVDWSQLLRMLEQWHPTGVARARTAEASSPAQVAGADSSAPEAEDAAAAAPSRDAEPSVEDASAATDEAVAVQLAQLLGLAADDAGGGPPADALDAEARAEMVEHLEQVLPDIWEMLEAAVAQAFPDQAFHEHGGRNADALAAQLGLLLTALPDQFPAPVEFAG